MVFAPSREEGEAAKGGKYLIDFLFSQDFPVRPLDFFSLPVRHSIRLSQLDLFAEFDIRGGCVRVAALQRGVKVIFLVKRQKIIWDVLDAPDTHLCVVITLIGIGKPDRAEGLGVNVLKRRHPLALLLRLVRAHCDGRCGGGNQPGGA